jgi:hypothetical protein
MKAKAQEASAKVIEAEAEVPKAMAEAFRNGNLGIMDYVKYRNVEADTAMRESIAKPQQKPTKATNKKGPCERGFFITLMHNTLSFSIIFYCKNSAIFLHNCTCKFHSLSYLCIAFTERWVSG